MSWAAWFAAFNQFGGRQDVARVREGIEQGLFDAQDEWGMTALHLAVAAGWIEGAQLLLHECADASEIRP
jgi:hypothetical protein